MLTVLLLVLVLIGACTVFAVALVTIHRSCPNSRSGDHHWSQPLGASRSRCVSCFRWQD
jgi:hypothetical protein